MEENRCQPIKPFFVWLLCLFISSILLMICSKSSPLYPFNDWVDANAFFTMGKGMINGKIPYRDLFEQKGPLLYLIHGFSYIISPKTFHGVFIFEVWSFSWFLFFCHKIIALFAAEKYSLISLPIMATLILNSKSFAHGDSAEEFCLPLLTISLYYIIQYFLRGFQVTNNINWIFINGIIAGCVFWIKFTLTGFWIGWFISLLFSIVIKGEPKHAIKSAGYFLAGFVISTIPWLIYFGVNKSILYWINTYIIINITAYPISTTLLDRLLFILVQISSHFYANPIFGCMLWFGFFFFIFHSNSIPSRVNRIFLCICGLLLVLGIYGGGRGYVHYFLIISPFIVFGVIFLLINIDNAFPKLVTTKYIYLSLSLTILASSLYSLLFNNNIFMLRLNKNDLVQYKYASIINQSKDATLLNYGSLDMGFYTVTGITPNIRFFENQNISYAKFPIILDEQNRYIREKAVDFVVFRYPTSTKFENLSIPYLLENYKLLQSEKQMYETIEFFYLLFEKIP